MESAAIEAGVVRRWSGLHAFVAVVVALALAGGLLAARLLAAEGAAPEPAPAAAPARANDLGREFRTSFGVVAAIAVQQVRGLTAKELAGLTHFPSYVPSDQMQVRTVVQLSNVLARPVRYSARQFSLRVGAGPPLAASGSSITTGTLQPAAGVELTLSFITPRPRRGHTNLTLVFREHPGATPLLIDLGRAQTVTRAPAPTIEHAHVGRGRSP